MEEQRVGLLDLERRISVVEQETHDIKEVLVGTRDPLTGQFTGGMRSELGRILLAQERFDYRASNGGINIHWSYWQRLVLVVSPVLVGGGFAFVQSLLDG